MAETLSRVMKQPMRYKSVPPEVYRSFGFPGADDLGNMFQYYQEFEKEFCDDRPLDRAKQLNPEMQSFDEWAEKNAEAIPIPE